MGEFDNLFRDAGEPVPEAKPRRPSRAVVACDGKGNGCCVWFDGDGIENEIVECGLSWLDDLGLDDAPQGIWIWEGDYYWVPPGRGEHPAEGGYTEPKGKFRLPDLDEWDAIRRGVSPWTPCST